MDLLLETSGLIEVLVKNTWFPYFFVQNTGATLYLDIKLQNMSHGNCKIE